MDAEAVINLFDSWWSTSRIISSPSNPKTNHQNHLQNQEICSNPNVSSPVSINTTSRNDQSLDSNSIRNHQLVRRSHISTRQIVTRLNHDDSDPSLNFSYTDYGVSFSPNSVLFSSNLKTIFSCKQEMEKIPLSQQKKFQNRRRKTKKGKSKTLSELECEEVKGFMDLGFVFSEEDRHSNLVEMLPGLQRLGKEKHDNKNGTNNIESSVIRPYLSEAWSVFDKQRVDKSLMKWRIPVMSSEKDIKLSLKWWAHTVASVVA